ncbi:MAG: bifunctional lysylphosphatidylglycerol flippase/synthetase MprF [Rhodobacter sp.]|nr:bifunctional lysylphosphatidylglycerol flippase/synthetase MprF [Rhodobacter sp.]MCA3514104.1 bifunctional lysylphosphatidylglycerol flippase/synthetase MprF [Rhodobacter sp.]MCA3520155.1 bifunctional lysylphosphatidylglycerol flippase/synthetase MprF [Rhodobacter sp.]MCA3522086.1 bifunctional lysylphosphatidylglycerol flippase/synthetase MprF [Rhodobacter sp.]MCA3527897.1 bifunctional lysylphosphatidylglycerol flippase/synthetase MprF [Rhodobacter sp.]
MPLSDRAAGIWQTVRAVFPYALAMALFALGLYAVLNLLAEVKLADVIAQVRSTPVLILVLAQLSALAGYLFLVGYDWSGLRYIGKPLPLPVTLTGGLMAYAFGNTIGLSVVSGGAVRYRIYSGQGLDAFDVAAVSTFVSVSYGIAATVVGLGAVALYPDLLGSLAPFPASQMRWLAIGLILAMTLPLVVAGAYNISLRLGRFTLRAPSLPVLLGQALFSLGDITCAAMTLYLLLPAGDIGFSAFVGIFATATMAGVISHVPGGVGVFETVVLAALPDSVPIETAAAALLMFRIIYFIVPFLMALVVLALYEALVVVRRATGRQPLFRLGRRMAAMAPTLGAISPMAPAVLSVMIFGAGLWMSFAALIPSTTEAGAALERVFPLVLLEGGALMSSILGAVLIVLALGVARRSLGAYWLTLGAMAVGIVVAMIHAFDIESVITLGIGMLILLPFRREFHRRTGLVHGALSPVWFVLVFGLILSVGFVLVFAHRGTPYSSELWWQFAADQQVPRALRAGLLLALLVAVAALTLLLRVPRLHPVAPTDADLARAARIVASQANPDAALSLTGDKSLLFSDDGRGFIMYGVQGRSWIAFGGPVGAPETGPELGWAFCDAARRAGARPVFYQVGEDDLPLMLDLGLSLHKLGERGVVDLRAFSLEGAGRKKLRAAHARAGRDGLTLEIQHPPHEPALIAGLRRISDEWLAAKKTREKRFSVGRFDPGWIQRWPVALVRHQGRIVGFANLLQTEDRLEVTVDLMRHRSDVPAGVMDFLFTDLMLQMKAQGTARFSMGMAPLSGLDSRKGVRLWNRFGAAIFQHGGHFYNFSGLRAFKAKFDPQWEPRYLAVPSSRPPLMPLADAALLIAGGTRGVVPARGHA